jgi:hypothetical protein
MRHVVFMSLVLGVLLAPALAQQMTEQQQQKMEQLQKMQEMQEKSLESMTKSLPTMSGFMNSMTGVASKFEEMKKERSDIVQKKTDELEARVEEVLALLDAGKKSRAKLKALSIKWTPIGTAHVDKERAEHFDYIRKEVIDLIEGS